MALNATEQARQELTELERLIEECRRDLGISHVRPSRSAKHRAGLFRRGLRGSRQARRQAPVS